MSHAKEIRQKKELQARFQLAVNSTSSLVSGWLKPATASSSGTSSAIIDDPSKHAFFNLPIIGGSSGLSLEAPTDSESADISTIGDYVRTGKSLISLGNKKKGLDKPNAKLKQSIAHQSKALSALQTKIRQSNTQKHKRDRSTPIRNKQESSRTSRRAVDNDSDSDEDEPVQKSAPKKSFGLLIDSKIRKR
jgi:hypothetical protein